MRRQLISEADLGLHASRGAPTDGTLEEMTLAEAERALIELALRRHDGNISEAARRLGLSRSALYRRLKTHGL